MMRIIGHTEQGLIHTNQESGINFSVTEFKSSLRKKTNSSKEFNLNEEQAKPDFKVEVTHVSILTLSKENHCDEQSSKSATAWEGSNKETKDSFHLITITSKTFDTFSSSLLLVREIKGVKNCSEFEVLNKLEILEEKETEPRIYFLPRCAQNKNRSEEFDTDTTEEESEEDNGKSHFSCVTRLLATTLEESIVHYEVQSTISYINEKLLTTLDVLTLETVAKNFWWCQWLPHQEAIAFAHFRKPRQSSFEDDEVISQAPKPVLSVLQFHKDFPRESVLNMPLELEIHTESKNKNENNPVKLFQDPDILTSSEGPNLKLLAHPTGAVYLFHIRPESDNSLLKYSVQMLHNNKTLDVEVDLKKMHLDHSSELRLDVGQYSKDQYLMVVGWPYFVHFLDVGSTHEPSHHLIFDWSTLMGNCPSKFICVFNARNNGNGKNVACDEKTDLSPKYSTTTNIVFDDMSHTPIELASSILLPLMEGRKSDIGFKLAVLHHFLVHIGDINVAKRIVYDEGKKRGNLFLKRIYQEFLIGHAHLQTKKQLLPNMDSFLFLIPYSADPQFNSTIKTETLTIKVNSKPTDVSIMLLSPSQRVFPHNVTDLWTCLWQLNRNYSRSLRFSHKDVADKLILSLQCYKPESLSRVSTPGPMSPSSPMTCSSLGDIVGMFGRRATADLNLPFLEHESCTANKQEYIFSINLREMSMHLLKERKEWPLHGSTVAGKYVCSLGDTARLLCHLLCLTAHLQPTNNRDKGFNLIDSLEWGIRLKLFMLMEHYSLALTTLACPLPQGFTPFFAYLGYRVLKYDQFLWHVRSGTFELQIDLVKSIMADLTDDEEINVSKKLQLLSLLPKTRANRILNTWSHKVSVCIRARQHASDLLSGSVSQNRKRIMSITKKGVTDLPQPKEKMNSLDTFFQLLTAKANASEIDLGLLTEATLISMEDAKDERNSRQKTN